MDQVDTAILAGESMGDIDDLDTSGLRDGQRLGEGI
jgi:hypothetical protein